MLRNLCSTAAHNLHWPHSLRISKSKKEQFVGRANGYKGRGFGGGGRSRAVLECSCSPCAAAGRLMLGRGLGLMAASCRSTQRRLGEQNTGEAMFREAGPTLGTPLNASPATSRLRQGILCIHTMYYFGRIFTFFLHLLKAFCIEFVHVFA
jgi:hypothetical protein